MAVCLKMEWRYVLSHLSHVQLFVTLWTIAHKAPLSTGFSRQEYWSGLTLPSPWDLPTPGIEPASLVSCFGRQVLYYFTTLLLKNANHNLSLQGVITFVLVEGLASMLIAAE